MIWDILSWIGGALVALLGLLVGLIILLAIVVVAVAIYITWSEGTKKEEDL